MPKIPDCLAHLPTYAGLPVPYFSAMHPDGRPNFRAHNTVRHNRSVRERLCCVCGSALGYWAYIVMGPQSLAQRETYMPPMHRECLLAAFALCPYLANEVQGRSHASPESMRIVPIEDLPPKPKRVAIVAVRKWKPFLVEENPHQLYLSISRPRDEHIEWWHYVDNRLVPERGNP